ncbi:CHCH domain-containing protein [Trichonephila inaurata madagascariensis]|uniref:CHCH domain-containing protein n=1 Tax=Trichonephila inaurata madagascariensis TaxID=2747483 RepID=A0A8X7CMV6_9ARAC|nr:CHCH domain-containing protein [Trichonephila inaurata madagascariensis]
MALPMWVKLPKRGRRPQTEKKTPFREEWPMVLENQVSTRRGKTKDVPCLTETLAFITCLKDNNNAQELCKAQSEAVQKCYHNHLAYKKELQKRKKTSTDFIPEISAKDMDPVQLNKFLSNFPHKLKKS